MSIVNWTKGDQPSPKKLFKQLGDNRDSSGEIRDMPRIGPSLSFEVDVSTALPIRPNSESSVCYQGQYSTRFLGRRSRQQRPSRALPMQRFPYGNLDARA
ncbi:MAG: hypothetical protein KJ049_04455 [Gammaproteobacteria bacterium]|nr:hypothetical protein [Gammaproteobacteria bacterium]